MHFSHKNIEDSSYLIYTLDDGESIDEIAYKMISSNSINGVFKLSREDEDGVESLYIDVTSKVTLAMLLEKPAKRDLVLGVLKSIAHSCDEADEYMLDPRYFIFDFEHIYIDLSTKTATLVYLPILREAENLDVKTFVKHMLFDIVFDMSEDCNYVVRLINLINDSEALSINRLVDVIEELSRNPQAMRPVMQSTESIGMVQSVPQVEATPVQSEQKPVAVHLTTEKPVVAKKTDIPQVVPEQQTVKTEKKKSGLLGLFERSKHDSEEKKEATPAKNGKKGVPIPGQPVPSGFAIPGKSSGEAATSNKSQPAGASNVEYALGGVETNTLSKSYQPMPLSDDNSGRTVIIGGAAADDGRTVIIGGGAQDETQGIARITRLKTNEVVIVDKDVFKIGKEREFVDYCIRDNATISRIHAQIEKKDGQFYIKDINSRNHCYLSGNMSPLQPNQSYQLRNGIHFVLSDEEFIFSVR